MSRRRAFALGAIGAAAAALWYELVEIPRVRRRAEFDAVIGSIRTQARTLRDVIGDRLGGTP